MCQWFIMVDDTSDFNTIMLVFDLQGGVRLNRGKADYLGRTRAGFVLA